MGLLSWASCVAAATKDVLRTRWRGAVQYGLIAEEQWHDDGPLDNYDLTLHAGGVDVVLRNQGVAPMLFTLALDEHYPSDGSRMRTVRVMPGIEAREYWPLSASDHWYDFLVTLHDAPDFMRRFARKVETGRPGRTDPGIGPMRLVI